MSFLTFSDISLVIGIVSHHINSFICHHGNDTAKSFQKDERIPALGYSLFKGKRMLLQNLS